MRTAHVPIVPQSANSYAGVEQLLYREDGRWVHGRKVNHNTFLERRGAVQGVALKLHSTDILLWRTDNTVTLNTGGWLTATTRARMNEWLPDVRRGIQSRRCEITVERGYWIVQFTTPNDATGTRCDLGLSGYIPPNLTSVPYHDGMIIDLTTLSEFTPTYDDSADHEWNAGIDKKLEEWLAGFTKLTEEGQTMVFGQKFIDNPDDVRAKLLYVLGMDGMTTDTFKYPKWIVSLIRETGIRRNTGAYMKQQPLPPATIRLLKDDLRKLFRGYLYRGYHARRRIK